MSEYHRWLSSSRSGILYMTKNWNEPLLLHGQRWLVLPADVTEQCREAFTGIVDFCGQ